jgi:proline iminopeptidase
MPGGPGGNHTIYDSIVKALAQHINLILFDPRGCGHSSPSDPQYCTISHYIDDVEAIRQHYNIAAENFILLGASYGAMAALGYAIQYPAKLKKLILIGGAASGEFITQAQANLLARGTEEQRQVAEKLWAGTFVDAEDFAEYRRIMAPLYQYSYNEDSPPPVTTNNIPYNVAVANLGFSQFLRVFDYRPQLSEVSCQTLILAGQNDWINDPRQAQLMHRDIANSRLVIYQNCGHFIWLDRRDDFLQELLDFIVQELDQ